MSAPLLTSRFFMAFISLSFRPATGACVHRRWAVSSARWQSDWGGGGERALLWPGTYWNWV